MFYADYRRALAYLAAHVDADGRERHPSGKPARVVADAKAAVALAEGGRQPAAGRLVGGLLAPWANVRSLSAALWAVTTLENGDAGTKRPERHWPWIRAAARRVFHAAATSRQLSPDTLALSAAALRSAAAAARLGGDWWSAWWWARHARFLAHSLCRQEIQRSASARDYIAGARWGLIPHLPARRLLVGLDHLGLVEPGLGLRAWPDPERGGFTVDAETTFDYVEALSKSGLGARAMSIYVAALPMVGRQGVDRRLIPMIGRGRGIPEGGVGIGATAQYLLATDALVRGQQWGLGWRATEFDGPHGRQWIQGRRWWDPVVPFHSERVALYVQGGDGGSVFRGLMGLLIRGWVPVVFWDRPWPDLPTRPRASLAGCWRQFEAVVVLTGDRADRRWRRLRRAGARVLFRPRGRYLLPGDGRRRSRRAWLALAGRLADTARRDYSATEDGASIWLQAPLNSYRPLWPAYLWPVSQWIAANQTLARLKRPAVPLSRLMDTLHPYLLGRQPGPVGYTAAAGDPAGLAFYDDNGWVLLDDIDAFRLTADTRWIECAERVFDFMASGWDWPRGGGEWFNTQRTTRTETATGTFLLGAEDLYATTHDPRYRRWAVTIADWNAKHMLTLTGLYGDHLSAVSRSQPSGVPFPYDSGLVIDADVQPGRTDRSRGIREAERLADTVLEMWQDPVTGRLVQLNGEDPAEQDAFDAIFLNSLVGLYRVDPNPGYRRAVLAEASGVVGALAPNGLVRRDWSDPAGASASYSLLTQASALAILVDAATMVRSPGNQSTRAYSARQLRRDPGKGLTVGRSRSVQYVAQ